MTKSLDLRRILIFLGFAFGIAWSVNLAIYLTGGLQNSPAIAGLPVNLAFLLLAGPVMWAPAIANILTRWITREGFNDTGLRPNFRQGWKFWLSGWILPGVLTILGAGLFFALFPQYYDGSLNAVVKMLERAGQSGVVDPWVVVIAQTVQGILIAPLVNGVATFGEEFGWRGYLQQKLLPLGARKAMLLMGVIWGVWHWPVIWMGYNYGFNYPGYPVLGPLAMVWFCIAVGTFLGWITLRGGSVWPAVIGHAAVNGMAGFAIFFIQGTPNTILGPTPVGIIGAAGYALVALWIFVRFKPGE